MRLRTIHTKKLRWIEIVNPGPEETTWLRDNFHFHALHFDAVAQKQQRPRLDTGEGYEFMVLLFPVYQNKTQEIVAGEVDFFVGTNFVITVHYGQMFTLKRLFEETQNDVAKRNKNMQSGPGFLLYRILESLFRRSYPILDYMSEDIEKIEKKIFRDMDIQMLSEISMMRKNIIEFRKMMKTHRYVLEKLPRANSEYLSFGQSKIYYKDLLDYSENIWDILEALKETAETLADTNQSLATHRLNQITKMISIFSAIALPATLVAFVFGIGVDGIPFRHHPYGFWIVTGIMTAGSAAVLIIFKHKKWF